MRWPWRRDRSKAWAEYLARVDSEGDQTPHHVRVVSDEDLAGEAYELADDEDEDA